ncbi:MAG: alpha/beta hydrolase, partial [Acidobacteriota bacterium]|nr:alpha/beta hydrolase [Acidobacteriota bacterium]
MSSWQSLLVAAYIRTVIRRRKWGDEENALARRARRHFGTLRLFQWLSTRGLRISTVCEPGVNGKYVKGEWVEPKNPNQNVIFYMHGGGYVACSPATHRPITAALARLSNCRVFSLDYRLAPEHRFSYALDDAVDAYQWLRKQGVPVSALSLAGDSAGGGLVLGTLLRLRDEARARGDNQQPAASAVCFSPWADLADIGERERESCAMFFRENVRDFAKAYLGDLSPLDPKALYASPALVEDLSGLPPLLLQVGSKELLRDDACRVDKKIKQAGGVCILDDSCDSFHCWQM